MNKTLLSNAISNIDYRFIEEASEYCAFAKANREQKPKKRIAYFGLASAAAAAVAVAIVVPIAISGTIDKPNGNLSGSSGANGDGDSVGGSAPGGNSPQHIFGLGHTQTGSLGSICYTERGYFSVTFELEITENSYYKHDIDITIYNEEYIISTEKGYESLRQTVLDSELLVVTVNGEQAERIPNQVGRYVVSVDYSACKTAGGENIIFSNFSVWYWRYQIYTVLEDLPCNLFRHVLEYL